MEKASIIERLEKLPSELETAKNEWVDMWEALAHEENNLKIRQASLYLEYKNTLEKPTVKELEAKVDLDTGADQSKVIVAEGNMKRAEIATQKLKDEFDAVRKLCGLVEAEMRMTGGM